MVWAIKGNILVKLNKSDEAGSASQKEAKYPGNWSDWEQDGTPLPLLCPPSTQSFILALLFWHCLILCPKTHYLLVLFF
jgi:hypothetical protein